MTIAALTVNWELHLGIVGILRDVTMDTPVDVIVGVPEPEYRRVVVSHFVLNVGREL